MRTHRLATAILALTVFVGCSSGPKVVIARGTITNGGKPIAASTKDGLTIVFTPAAGGTTFPAGIDKETNVYEVYGPKLKGIPPGKYKVSINIMSSKPSPANDSINAHYSTDKTPIEVEVPEDGKLDIDLAKFKPK